MSHDTDRIRTLNDSLRQHFLGGGAVMTPGVAALGQEFVDRAVKTLAAFDDFHHENDPHQEHDAGVFEVDGHVLMFKIDYYDRSLKFHSPNPVWATSVAIDVRIGGAKVSHNARFAFSGGANATLLDHFQNTVREHLRGRLGSMLETEEAFFQLCNMGIIKIGTIDPDGHYRWELASNNSRVGGNVRRKNGKTV